MTARGKQALLIAAADDATATRALARLRQQVPAAHVVALVRPGATVPANELVEAPVEGAYGFALTSASLRAVRRRYDVAWAVVSDLDSPSYRRVALLLSLTRTREKAAVGPNGTVVPLAAWLSRTGLTLGPLSLVQAAVRQLGRPFRMRRASRLLRGASAGSTLG